MLGHGWWDDVTGFFTKAYDATIGKIPVVGDIGRKVAGVVLNPINTLGHVAQKVTEGDVKGAASEALSGVKRTVGGPNLAQALTSGTPLSGVADLATEIVHNTVKLPGTSMSIADARDAALAATSGAEALLGKADATANAEEEAAAPDAVGGGWFTDGLKAGMKAALVSKIKQDMRATTHAGAMEGGRGIFPILSRLARGVERFAKDPATQARVAAELKDIVSQVVKPSSVPSPVPPAADAVGGGWHGHDWAGW